MRHLAILLLAATLSAGDSGLAGAYADPDLVAKVGFGGQPSHHLQGWRGWMETYPAARFLAGVGIGLPPWDSPMIGAYPQLCALLGRQGIRSGRIEIDWISLRYDDERIEDPQGRLRAALAAMRSSGIRPLILLNGHQGKPCPLRWSERRLVQPAARGARTLVLDSVDGLEVWRSGPCDLTQYWAAECLITAIDAGTRTVTLGKALPVDLAAGPRRFATLRYLPFGPPGAELDRTIAGWKHYARTVAAFAAEALGTTGKPDLGFDLEVWNELSFASNFLLLNRYLDQGEPYQEDAVWWRLPHAVGDAALETPAQFAGVRIVDGMANTIPWPAAQWAHPRLAALCKHPYFGPEQLPEMLIKRNQAEVLVPGFTSARFTPSYRLDLPEYHLSWLQSDTLVRDLFPGVAQVRGDRHGRDERAPGRGGSYGVWITEVGWNGTQRQVPAGRFDRVKAIATLRLWCAYLGRGAQVVLPYSATEGWDSFGLVPPAALAAINAGTATATTDPGLPLTAIGRLTAALAVPPGGALQTARQMAVRDIRDSHGRMQFPGEGAVPPLYDREVLFLAPLQLNPRRFAVIYYVMTRDCGAEYAPARFTVALANLRGAGARVSALDPLDGLAPPVGAPAGDATTLTVEVEATSYPRLLLIDEAADGPLVQNTVLTSEALEFTSPADGTAAITWGPCPGRSGAQAAAAVTAGRRVQVALPGLAAGHGVRVVLRTPDGLEARWPLLGNDSDGAWQPPAVAAAAPPTAGAPALAWPDLAPAAEAVATPAAPWSAAGAGRWQAGAQAELLQVPGTREAVAALLPARGTTDRLSLAAGTWNGRPAWLLRLALDRNLHPGERWPYRLLAVAPAAGGHLVAELRSATEPAASDEDRWASLLAAVAWK